jgi:hypothetical protein
MRKLIVLLAVAVGVFATSALPAGAITGDSVEDTEHPFVGLVAFFDDQGQYSHRCSGSLLTPTVFLTAGHCTTDFFGPTATARVYFQQDAGANYDPETGVDPVTGFPEYCAPGTLGVSCATSDELYDYDYATSGPPWREFPDIRDVGLVILDQPIILSEYGQLAADGTLDELSTRRGQKQTTFTLSGYGLTEANPAHEVSAATATTRARRASAILAGRSSTAASPPTPSSRCRGGSWAPARCARGADTTTAQTGKR